MSVVLTASVPLAAPLAQVPPPADDPALLGSGDIIVDLSVLENLPPRDSGGPQYSPDAELRSRFDERLAQRLGLAPSLRPPAPGEVQGPVTSEPASTPVPPAMVPLEPMTPPPIVVPDPPPSIASLSPTPEPQTVPESKPQPAPEAEAVMNILFASGSAILSDDYKDGLRGIGARMQEDADLRLRLVAHAALDGESELFARRLSLSRSLAVRNFLIAAGIEQTRMTVQAMGAGGGAQAGDVSKDRVDAFYVKR
ncbi:MAG: OmpA family protein [Alphaproteobacteria bacterium]|nr:OmpA family protein [Alphaproteobacteria bacterium]